MANESKGGCPQIGLITPEAWGRLEIDDLRWSGRAWVTYHIEGNYYSQSFTSGVMLEISERAGEYSFAAPREASRYFAQRVHGGFGGAIYRTPDDPAPQYTTEKFSEETARRVCNLWIAHINTALHTKWVQEQAIAERTQHNTHEIVMGMLTGKRGDV